MKHTNLFYYTDDSDDQSVDSASSEAISTLEQQLKCCIYNIVFAAKNADVDSDTPVQISISNHLEFNYLVSNLQLLTEKYKRINLSAEQGFNFDIPSLEMIAGYEPLYIIDRSTNNNSTAQILLFSELLKQSLEYIEENPDYTVMVENTLVLDSDIIKSSLTLALKQCKQIISFMKLNTERQLRYEKNDDLPRTIDFIVNYKQHMRLIVICNRKTCANSSDDMWYERSGSFKKVKRSAFDITEIFRGQPQELARASIFVDENHDDRCTLAILRELSTLKQLSKSPYVATAIIGSKFFDINDDEKVYIFADFAAGNLNELLDVLQNKYRNASDIPKLIKYEILLNIAEGLQYVHSQSFIHRDISSSNVLLFRDLKGKLTAKLSDFGKARLVMEEAQSCGTYDYAGPEVFHAHTKNTYYASPKRIALGRMINQAGLSKYSVQELAECKIANQKDDIWALGIVAAELFSDVEIDYSIVNEYFRNFGINLAKKYITNYSSLILSILENKRCDRPYAEEIASRVEQLIKEKSPDTSRKRAHDNSYESRQLKQFSKLKI